MAIFNDNKDDKMKAKVSTKDLYADTGVAKTKKGEKPAGNYASAYRVLLQPLITEKASHGGVENKYFFEISKKTNKIEVAKAIKQVYGIVPEKINIINTKGKLTRYGKTRGKKSDWKKAIVTLPEGKTINVYEGV